MGISIMASDVAAFKSAVDARQQGKGERAVEELLQLGNRMATLNKEALKWFPNRELVADEGGPVFLTDAILLTQQHMFDVGRASFLVKLLEMIATVADSMSKKNTGDLAASFVMVREAARAQARG